MVAAMVAVVEHRGWLTTAAYRQIQASVFSSRPADGQAASRTVCLLVTCRFAALDVCPLQAFGGACLLFLESESQQPHNFSTLRGDGAARTARGSEPEGIVKGVLPDENQPLASWRSQVTNEPTHLWAVAAVGLHGSHSVSGLLNSGKDNISTSGEPSGWETSGLAESS